MIKMTLQCSLKITKILVLVNPQQEVGSTDWEKTDKIYPK